MRCSVAIPIFNEEQTLPTLAERVKASLEKVTDDWETLFVDDGSTDGSWTVMQQLHEQDGRFAAVRLSRNFGHQAACTAALENVTGDVVVLMDGDLEDPPEMIPQLIAKLDEGYDVVYAVKRGRSASCSRRLGFWLFYRVQVYLSAVPMKRGAGTFSAMRRRVVDCINAMPETNRYISGLRSFTGFKQTGIEFDRPGRHAGRPRQTLSKLLKMALDGIFSFSYIPARLATWLGMVTAVLSLIVTVIVLYKKLITQTAILGWTSTMLSHLFIGAIQLICLGILGEYLVRIYDEVRRRPLYVTADRVSAVHESGAAGTAAKEAPEDGHNGN